MRRSEHLSLIGLLLLVLGGLLIKRQSLSHESNRITSFLKGEVR